MPKKSSNYPQPQTELQLSSSQTIAEEVMGPRRRGRKRKISGEKFESELLLAKKLRASDYNPSGRKLWQLAKTNLGYDISYPG